MKEIFSCLDKRIAELKQTQFCDWLASNPVESSRFAFAPAQAFLVFGFRDMLEYLQIKNPQGKWEEIINAHCQEDIDHWKWYLNDLDRLGFNLSKSHQGFSHAISRVWDQDCWAVRDLVYTCIHYIKSVQNPMVSLVIVEALEGAFEAFIENMKISTQKNGNYDELEYYGRLHVEKEESHHLWGDVESQLLTEELGVNERAGILKMVNHIFDLFDQVFDTWYLQANKYSQVKERTSPPIDRSVSEPEQVSSI